MKLILNTSIRDEWVIDSLCYETRVIINKARFDDDEWDILEDYLEGAYPQGVTLNILNDFLVNEKDLIMDLLCLTPDDADKIW